MSRVGGIAGRTLREERRGLVGWVAGVAFLTAWLLAMYPSISGSGDLSRLLDSYPETMQKMFQLQDFTSGAGYLRAEVFSLTLPLMLVIAAVLWGSDAVAGEEDRHTLDLLLAHPVRRSRALVEKWAAVTGAVLLIGGAAGVVLSVGVPAAGLDVGLGHVWAAVAATTVLAAAFAAVALAVGAATGRRGLARGVTLVLAVAAYLVSSLADVVSWLAPVRPLSPWYHALGVDPVATGLHPWRLLALVALVLVVTGAGAVAFERRDLGA